MRRILAIALAVIGLIGFVCTAAIWYWATQAGPRLENADPHRETPFSEPGLTINSMHWSVHLSRDEKQIVTLAKYEKIHPGMTYDELTAVLGLPADRWRPPDIDYVSAECSVKLTWTAGAYDETNKEWSITVHLKGKTVTSKSQSGLKAQPPDKAKDGPLGMKFVPLPKATFYMGGGGGKVGKKTEIKEVFEIAIHTVTQGQWQAMMGKNPSKFSRDGEGKEKVKDIKDEELKLFPVESVSWYDAQEKLVHTDNDAGTWFGEFTPDGQFLVVPNSGWRGLSLWSVRDKKHVRDLGPVGHFAISPYSGYIAVAEANGRVRFTRIADGALIARFDAPGEDYMGDMTFSPDGRYLVGMNADRNQQHAWDLWKLRRRLAEMKLDWETEPVPEPRVEVSSIEVVIAPAK